MVNRLYVVSSKEEANKAIKSSGGKSTEFIAVGLEAEFAIKDKFSAFTNPAYKIKGLDSKKSVDDYYFSNFELTYSWFKNPHFKYIQEKLGFYIAELERSLDFAGRIIKKYRPKRILVGDYSELDKISLIDVRLEPLAIALLAKSHKIQLSVLKTGNGFEGAQRGRIGKFIQFIRSHSKQTIKGDFDVLLVTHPSKLANMQSFAKAMKENNLSTAYLTYELTRKEKNKIESFLDNYLEKERLIGSQEIIKAREATAKLLRGGEWKSFVHPKYAHNKTVIAYMRHKVRDMVQGEMENTLKDHFLAKRLLGEMRPKMLFTLTDPDTKALVYINAAKELGILTVSVQHGVDFDKIPYSKPVSDYYLVWSKLAKNHKLINKTSSTGKYMNENRILVASSPFHSIPKKVRVAKNGPKPILLLLLTNHLFDKTIWNYYLIKLFEKLKVISQEFEIIVRLHPHQTPYDFEAIRVSICRFKFANEEDLYDLIVKSRAIIFENTTAGLDAMLFAKPAIYYNPYTGEDFFDLGKRHAALSILSQEDIDNKLNDFLLHSSSWPKYRAGGRKFAIDYLGIGGKNSKFKTAMIIKDLIKKTYK